MRDFRSLITPLLLFALVLPALTACEGAKGLETGWVLQYGDSPRDAKGDFLWSRADFADKNWRPYKVGTELQKRPDSSIVWLRLKMPERGFSGGTQATLSSLESRPALFFDDVVHLLGVYLDGELIYREAQLVPGTNEIQFLGSWPLVPIRRDFAGRTLALRMHLGHDHEHGITGGVYLDTWHTLQKIHIWMNLEQLVPASLFLLIGTTLLIIAGVRRETELYLPLSVFVLSSGVLVLTQSTFAWYVSGLEDAWNYINRRLPLLLPVGLLPFFRDALQPALPRFFTIAWKVHLLAALSSLLPFVPINLILPPIYIIFAVEMLFMSALAMRAAARGEKDASIFLLGFVFMCLAGINDLSLAMGLLTHNVFLFRWGLLLFISALASILARRYFAAGKRLAELNRAYERFVPAEFLKFLGKPDIIRVRLGDQIQKEMTILFSDIRSFTSLSEKMEPAANFAFLNDYLKRIGPCIREHGGFIDKYIGDAVMALFPGDPDHALRAALDIAKRLKEFNSEREAKGLTPIETGMGIHTGVLMLGTIGEDRRMEGTVISDAVNLASRMEGLTKIYDAKIVVSGPAAERLRARHAFTLDFLGNAEVKGKETRVDVYRLAME